MNKAPKLTLAHEGDERNSSSWKYLHAIFHKSETETEELKEEILKKKPKFSVVDGKRNLGRAEN